MFLFCNCLIFPEMFRQVHNSVLAYNLLFIELLWSKLQKHYLIINEKGFSRVIDFFYLILFSNKENLCVCVATLFETCFEVKKCALTLLITWWSSRESTFFLNYWNTRKYSQDLNYVQKTCDKLHFFFFIRTLWTVVWFIFLQRYYTFPLFL